MARDTRPEPWEPPTPEEIAEWVKAVDSGKPAVIKAKTYPEFRVKQRRLEEALRRTVFSFQVLDEGAEVLTYGCVAQDLDDAKEIAKKAGFTELVLLESRPLGKLETAEYIDRQIVSNPFLGKEWLPWVDLFAPQIRQGRNANVWGLTVGIPPYTWGYGDGKAEVFIQGLNEADGSHHLEVGTFDLIQANNTEALQILELAGWEEPKDGLPLHHRVFEPGWNSRHVLHVAFQTLSVLFGVTPRDIFVPTNSISRVHASADIFDSGKWDGPFQMGSTAYALKGLHPISDVEPPKEVGHQILARRFGKETDPEH